LKLQLSNPVPSPVPTSVFGLKKLENLELSCSDTGGLDQLHKLEKLKKLTVSHVPLNILDHMKFGVFQNLEELDSRFDLMPSRESIREMNWIAPKLKKLVIRSRSSDTINAVLDNLVNPESVKIPWEPWQSWVPDSVHPKIKHLDIATMDCSIPMVEKFTQKFPNLQSLHVEKCSFQVTRSFFVTLLSGLKQLKTLYLRIHSEKEFHANFILSCFKNHGNHLEEVDVSGFITTSRRGSEESFPKFDLKKEPGDGFSFNSFYKSAWLGLGFGFSFMDFCSAEKY
jgi:hypothetical protein